MFHCHIITHVTNKGRCTTSGGMLISHLLITRRASTPDRSPTFEACRAALSRIEQSLLTQNWIVADQEPTYGCPSPPQSTEDFEAGGLNGRGRHRGPMFIVASECWCGCILPVLRHGLRPTSTPLDYTKHLTPEPSCEEAYPAEQLETKSRSGPAERRTLTEMGLRPGLQSNELGVALTRNFDSLAEWDYDQLVDWMTRAQDNRRTWQIPYTAITPRPSLCV